MGRGSYSKFRSKWWALCRIERVIRRGHPCNANTFAAELEVDPRTVRRYIDFLKKDLGAPIQWDPIAQRYEFTDLSWTMPNMYLSERELIALAISSRSLAACAPPPFSTTLQNLMAKLLDALPEDERKEIEALVGSIDFVPASVISKGQEWIEVLVEAIRTRTTVEMDYYVLYRQREERKQVDPYHLRFFSGTWYLIGHDHKTGHMPVFNLARIRALSQTDRTFRRGAFDAREYFRHCFGITVGGQPRIVQIRLTGRAAQTACERVWPDGFTYVPRSDGSGILCGSLGKLDDLLPWIAGFDGEAALLPEDGGK